MIKRPTQYTVRATQEERHMATGKAPSNLEQRFGRRLTVFS